MSRKRCFILTLVICLLFTTIVGCSPAKKPNTTPSKPRTTSDSSRVASAIDTIAGVNKSTVVLAGNTAYVGLDLKANVEKSKTKTIEKEASKKVQKVLPRIKTVFVSSDVDTVTRLKKVSSGIAAGKPVSSFTDELSEIGRRITPMRY
ncbi:YhcN/YlaJ family sporulation lipoprotein [Syntrophomonas erecta]